MNKKLGFTLYELVISMTLFFLVITLVLKFYVIMVGSKRGLEGRQLLVENSYHIMEKLQVQMKNYTIDYEEYFNRRLNGCDSVVSSNDANDFNWDVGENGFCDKFTYFGNRNQGFGSYPVYEHHLYNCSSLVQEDVPTFDKQVFKSTTNLRNGSGCFIDAAMTANPQSFGQYSKQFIDVNDDSDTITGAVGDGDDEDLGIGPLAIGDNINVKELYLISKDKEKRIYIRRALISTGDFDENGSIDKDSEKRYTLQLLKLKGFDIGNDHNLDNSNNNGAYDGKIDTRACDYSNGFLCKGDSIGTIYSGYKLPYDVNDGWVNYLVGNITLSKRNLEIYPTSDPSLSWGNKNMQINPFIKVGFQTKLYGQQWFEALPNVDAYTFSLQTTFDIRSFY